METAISIERPVPNRGTTVAQQQARQATIELDRQLTALMKRAQAGDEAAYAQLLHGILPIVTKMTRRQMAHAPASDHDDVLQDVLLSVHAARATYDPRRPFIPWLKAIVANRAVDFMRRQHRHVTKQVMSDEAIAEIADQSASESFGRYDAADALRKAIDALPSGQRAAVELLKLREMSLREAAALTGMSVSALKASVHRAVKTLRGSLADYQTA